MADNEAYVILDIRGMVLHAYNRGSDPEGIEGADGKTYNTAGYGLNRLLEAYPIFDTIPPRQIIAVWDGGNDYRRSLWPTYKKKRHERNDLMAPEQKTEQATLVQMVKDLLAGLGVTQMKVPGVEADDAIALLCERMKTNRLVVYTSDQDLLQLPGMHDHVQVILRDQPVTGSHKGIPLELIRLHKSIVGDSSDEYPGVVGLGKDKAWPDLHGAYGTDGMLQLEEIVRGGRVSELKAVAESTGDKNLNTLLEQFDHWNLQYQLADLHPEICEGVVGGKLVEIKWLRRVPLVSEVLWVLKEAGATGWIDRLKPWLVTSKLADNSAEGGQALGHYRDHLKDGPIVAFDYEAYDPLKHPDFQLANKQNRGNYVDVMSQKITGVSFCYGDNFQHAIYMPCDHKQEEGQGVNYDKKYVAWAVNLADESSTLFAQNAPFEVTLTLNDLGLPLANTVRDTALMASYVDEDNPVNLKGLSRTWLNYFQATYQETLDKAEAEDMSQLTPAQVLSYGCDDSIVTAHLSDLFWLITTIEGTYQFLVDKEFESAHELVRGFMAGVKFDYDRLHELDVKAKADVKEGMQALTSGLLENCKEYNQEGATTLFLDLQKLEDAKYRAGDVPEEKFVEKRQSTWEGIYESSKYVPYQEIREEVKVRPTPKPLTAVSKLLGFSAGVDKTTKKYLTEEWISTASQEATGYPEREKFVQLMLDTVNAKAWKKPDSQEYVALAGFCSDVLNPEDKVTKIGDELNFDSPKQMQQMLYAKLDLPIRMRSKVQRGSARDKYGVVGSPATDEKATAMALAEDVEKGDWRYDVILGYRKANVALTAQKLFFRPLPLWQHPLDGVVHPQIRSCGTVTHRPSGSSPNMLQLTKKDGGELRSCVRPRKEDHVIITADWSGQELRILASESKDPVLLDAYLGEDKKDVHSITAAAIAPAFLRLQQWVEERGLLGTLDSSNVEYGEFTDWLHGEDTSIAKAMGDIRKAAKGVNFLIVYMGGYSTLARNLLIKLELAKSLMNQTFARYPRVKPWQQETIEFARVRGYTETAYGVRRHLGKGILSKDDGLRSRLERQGVNAVIQGCLQAGTRVHTDEGLIPIEETVGKEVTVWTGAEWAKATGINRGPCELAEIELESGLTVYCDTRHKLKGSDLQWHDFADLEEGDLVALPKAGGKGFNTSEYEMGWPFLLGYWIGDGWVSEQSLTYRSGEPYKRSRWAVCGGDKKLPILEKIYEFLISEGFNPALRREDSKTSETGHYRVVLERKEEVSKMLEKGYWRCTSRTKRVPNLVWGYGGLDRLQFLYGYALSDGTRNTCSPAWNSPNKGLLLEVQLLLSAIGVDSSLYARGESYDLRSRLHNTYQGRKYPIGRFERDFNLVVVPFDEGDCVSRSTRKVLRNLDTVYQGIAERSYEAYLPHERQVYRYDKIVRINKLGVEEDTYTLSVEHPLHQFVADGVIHKNTAAGVLKETLAEVHKRKLYAKTGSFLIAAVYDELANSVPRSAAIDFCFELKEIMSLTPPGHLVPMVPEFSVSSDSWGRVIELGADITEDSINKALDKKPRRAS